MIHPPHFVHNLKGGDDVMTKEDIQLLVDFVKIIIGEEKVNSSSCANDIQQ